MFRKHDVGLDDGFRRFFCLEHHSKTTSGDPGKPNFQWLWESFYMCSFR